MTENIPSLTRVDLSNCDREQIQFASATLSHGFLLVLSEPELLVIQAGENAADFLGGTLNEVLGRPVDTWLDGDFASSLREHISRIVPDTAPVHAGKVQIQGRSFDAFVHRCANSLIAEFEGSAREAVAFDQNLFSRVHGTVAALQQTHTVQEFLNLAVTQIREFTGFDRVMAYEFLEDGSGAVRAESVAEGWEPFLDLHYPASDIPLPARRLFKLTWLRHQPDLGYTPARIVPELNPLTGKPADLSFALLRSVSVMYSQYLKNMGTQSSMVMTLLKDGELWGLIACHHHSAPRQVPFEIRAACQFIAQMVSLLLSSKQDQEDFEYGVKLQTTQSRLIAELALSDDILEVLLGGGPGLLDFIEAGGAALVLRGIPALIGLTPAAEQVVSLVAWLSDRGTEDRAEEDRDIFATDCLCALYPAANGWRETSSGVVAIRLASGKSDYILWFRPEFRRTVNWAGDPHKPVDISDDNQRLTPRTSFAIWQEIVSGKSRPWKAVERAAAGNLRRALVEVAARKAEQLSALYQDLQRTNLETEAEVKESRERLRFALKAARMGIWTWDVSEDLVECSQEITTLFGHAGTLSKLSSGAFLRHVHPSDREGVIAQLREAADRQGPFAREFRVLLPNGATRWIELQGDVSRGPSKGPVRAIAAARDITEKKLLEQEVVAAEKFESLGVMAGGIAHDFNNLLLSVIGSASLAQDTLPEAHAAHNLLSDVVSAGERAAVLTSQMLAYSGKSLLLSEQVDVTEVVREATLIVQSRMGLKTELALSLEHGLTTTGDANQIRQVIVNLITNAAESLDRKIGSIALSTRTQEIDHSPSDRLQRNPDATPGKFIRIEVRDTGCGIADEIKDKIFEPFFSTKFTGRGLGLAAVAGIVRAHKGLVRVTSTLGTGTSVVVLLPLATVRTQARMGAVVPVNDNISHAVLVVDDEPMILDLVSMCLSHAGFRVLTARSGTTALDLIAQGAEKISLVLLDLTMPGMSGQEVLRRLREFDPYLPVILSSGYSEENALSQIEGQEVAGFLQKPYTPKALVAKINASLNTLVPA